MLQALGFPAEKGADRGESALYCAGQPNLSAISGHRAAGADEVGQGRAEEVLCRSAADPAALYL